MGFGDLEPTSSKPLLEYSNQTVVVARQFSFYHAWHTINITLGLVLLSMSFRIAISSLQLADSVSVTETAAAKALDDVARRVQERRRSSHSEKSIKEALSQAEQETQLPSAPKPGSPEATSGAAASTKEPSTPLLLRLMSKIPIGAYTFMIVWLVWMPLFTVVYVFVEEWEPWQAFVFVATCISTIGSGNVAPTTQTGRLLTIVCGLVGIPLTFGAIAWVGQVSLHIVELQLKLASKIFRKGRPVANKMRVMACFNLLIGVYLHAVIVYSVAEEWPVLDSVYYVFTSFATIGFGDVEPMPSMELDETRHFSFYHFWHTGNVTGGLVMLSMLFRVMVSGLEQSEKAAGHAAAKVANQVEEVARRVTERRRSSHTQQAIVEALAQTEQGADKDWKSAAKLEA